MPHFSSMAHIVWPEPLHNSWVNQMTRETLHVLSPFSFFLFYKYTARRRSYTNHYYIQMNLITSQRAPCLRCLVFSLFQTHSVVFIQACVYSNTVCLRADSMFAYSYWCLVCVCTNTTQRFFGLQLKGWCMWNFIIIYHTGMCVKLHQHGTRQELQHNTRK